MWPGGMGIHSTTGGQMLSLNSLSTSFLWLTSYCLDVVGFLNNYLSQTLEDGEREEPTSQENDEDDFDLADESKSKVLQNCLTSIVDSLSHQNPKYVNTCMSELICHRPW